MRSFKKIAAMIMAVAMLCSFTALGATVTLTDIPDITTETTSVAITYTSDADQNTILAYAGAALSGANVVYVDQIAKGATQPTIDLTGAPVDTTYTVMVGGTDVEKAATDTFVYTDVAEKFNVTLDTFANGEVTYEGSLTQVGKDSKITFTIVPYLGYELTEFKVNGTDMVESVVDGVYTLTVEGDTTITPVFSVVNDEGKSLTYAKWFDVEESEDEGGSSNNTNYASKLFFGQFNPSAEKTVTSMGMALYVKNAEGNYVGFKTKSVEEGAFDGEQVDTYFAADPDKIIDNKYGIRFYAFDEGEYMIKAYAQYDDGSYAWGEEIEFKVD